jgi:diguanylate cyclase (GGDEF)-like protein
MRSYDLTATQLVDRIVLLEADRDRWQELAETDQLTGMANRFALERRTDAREGWFVVCDLDGFKRAQDAHPEGHAYGDRILREFADFLEGSTRTNRGKSNDRVAARTGGDEFVVWCPSRHGARRIKRLVRIWRSNDNRVGASAGLGKTLEAADAAMYLNKGGTVR